MDLAPSGSVRLTLLSLLAAMGPACFDPDGPPCAVVCGGGGLCPPEMTCRADGYCHGAGEAETCSTGSWGGLPDAAGFAADAPSWSSGADASSPGNADAGGSRRETFGGRPGVDHPGACLDTYITDAARGDHFDAASALRVEGQPVTRALLFCDLTAIPGVAVIERVELLVWTSDDFLESGDPMRLYRLREAWAAGEADYDERMNGVAWSTGGAGTGSHDDEALAELAASQASREYSIDLPPATIASWVDAPGNNHGLVVKSHYNDAGAELVSLDGTAARRPVLAVTWRWP